MTDTESIRNALESISDALAEHRIYPAYDEQELDQIAALQDELKARLKLTEQEAAT